MKYAKAPSTKKTWRDSLPIDMLLSAVSVLVVAQSSSEIPEGLMNNTVYQRISAGRSSAAIQSQVPTAGVANYPETRRLTAAHSYCPTPATHLFTAAMAFLKRPVYSSVIKSRNFGTD